MSEDTDKLKKALAENGNFDAEKAAREVSEASSFFDARLRRGARITWLSLIIVAAVLEFAFVGFILTFSTKVMVGFAILLVITIVLIGVLSIDQRITNTKIILLREIKLLRLEHLGIPTDRTFAPARGVPATGTSVWQDLSPRENMAWFLTLILVAVASNYFTFQLMDWGLTLTDESQVTLMADGSGSVVHKVSYRYQGFLPMTSSSTWTGDGFTMTQWLDGQGRELPMSVATIDGNRQYTVQFAEPIMPGDLVNYTTTTTSESAKMATMQGETWSYQGGAKLGGKGRKFLLETVRLPQGAEIVSVEPKPSQQFVRDGVSTVRFQTLVDQTHELGYTIQYRLPQENDVQQAPK